MPNICAVVVTYNRRDLLLECLAAIERQTHPCGPIVVIDNAGTDGTAELLRAQPGRVELHVLPRNIGAAGGFNAGMRAGYETGADMIWVMDDDVIAEPDALARLVEADALLCARDIAAPFLVSTARAPNGQLTNTPTIDLGHNRLSYHVWPDLLEHGLVPVRAATFVSILLPRRTLDEHGLPIASMFIWGEDVEFTARIARAACGYLVGASRVTHVRAQDGALSIMTETNPTRIGYHYYLARNQMWMKRTSMPGREYLHYVRSRLALIRRLLWAREYVKARVIARGVWAGLRYRPTIDRLDHAPAAATVAEAETRIEPDFTTMQTSAVG